MKRFSGIAVFVLAAVFAATGTDTAAREKTVGMSFAYNEFSATFAMPVKDRETIMISANLDMSGASFRVYPLMWLICTNLPESPSPQENPWVFLQVLVQGSDMSETLQVHTEPWSR